MNDKYEPVDKIPDGLKWKPAPGRPSPTHTKLVSTPGGFFALVRCRETGAVQHFRLKDMGHEMSSKAKLDAEPTREQVRYRVNAHCWFVDGPGRWFLVKVVDRTGEAAGTGTEKRITIESVTGFDADRIIEWPYGPALEFPSLPNNPMFMRLRPFKDRRS
jgi:hypothetical protein